MDIGVSLGPSSIVLLALVSANIVGIGLSREYFVNLVQRSSVKLSWTSLFGAVFLSCTLITGSADLGTIAFATIVLNSIFMAFPLFVRESTRLTKPEEEGPLYLGHVLIFVLVLTLGLLIMPSTTILPSLDGAGGLLGLYTVIGLMMVLLGRISSRFISSRSAESDEQEDGDESSAEGEDRPTPPTRQSGGVPEELTESESRD